MPDSENIFYTVNILIINKLHYLIKMGRHDLQGSCRYEGWGNMPCKAPAGIKVGATCPAVLLKDFEG